jgi:serine/threonine protein kinase
VAHLDLKPENALWEGDSWRFIDFGSACHVSMLDEGRWASTHETLTFAYAAPERFQGTPYDPFAADLYACALVVFELLTMRAVFHGDAHALRGAQCMHRIPLGLLSAQLAGPTSPVAMMLLDALAACASKQPRVRRDGFERLRECLTRLEPSALADAPRAVDAACLPSQGERTSNSMFMLRTRSP